MLRGQAREEVPTADEALLGSDGDEWASKDPWRVLRIQAEFVEGFDTLHGLPAAVSIFGSARTASTDPMYRQMSQHELEERFIKGRTGCRRRRAGSRW